MDAAANFGVKTHNVSTPFRTTTSPGCSPPSRIATGRTATATATTVTPLSPPTSKPRPAPAPAQSREAPPSSKSAPPLVLRLDVAVPDKVQLDHAFDLAVAIRQKSSPLLSEDDLPVVKSGEVRVAWPKSRSHIHLRIQVSAPDCEIHGEDSQLFLLYAGQDSPVCCFHDDDC